MLDALRKDLRHTIRSLRRQPGFTIVTIVTLALGIGANTAVFSVVNGVLLRPLPYPQPDRLQYVTTQFPGLGFNQFWMSLPEFVEFRDNNQAFSSIGAYSVGAVNLDTQPPSRPVSALVTSELMPTLNVQPLTGRWFTAADTVPNAPPVAILSYELWQRAYAGDPGIVGKTVQINNASEEIVGIMPRGYDVHDSKIEIWRPLTINPANFANSRGSHFLYLVGRLKDGVTPRAGARRHHPPARAVADDRATRARAESARPSRAHGPAARRHHRQHQAGAGGPAGGRWIRAADRVREPGEPAGRAGRLARARVRRSCGLGSDTGPAVPATADRRPRAHPLRRGDWRGARLRRVAGPHRHQRHGHPENGGRHGRSHGAGLHAHRRGGDGVDLRPGAAAPPGHCQGQSGDARVEHAHDGGRGARLDAVGARRRRNCAGRYAGRRRRVC